MTFAHEQEFQEFHGANPGVYQLVVRFALAAKDSGRKRYSMEAVFQRIRWYTAAETHGDGFKINNNFRSHYVRMLEHDYPQLVGFFEKRKHEDEERRVGLVEDGSSCSPADPPPYPQGVLFGNDGR